MMKKAYDYLQRLPGILLILYVQFILDTDIVQSEYSGLVKGCLAVAVLAASVILCPAVIRLFRRISIKYKAVLSSRGKKALWFTVFLLLSAAFFGLYYAATYPGGFSYDSIVQYRQVVTGEYNNWHPVLHTLLFFKLPLMITGGWIGSIVLFQLILFALVASYAAYTVLKYSNIPYALTFLIFILISPATAVMSIFPWKDIPFALMALLAASYAANTYFTKGEWLKKGSHAAAVTMVLVLATIFRHNAVLFTVPMLIAMLLYLKRRAIVIIGICFLASVILIEGPLYALLKVEQPGKRREELLGIPVAVIGGVAAEDPQALDEEMKDFIYDLAPEKYWTNRYIMGYYNTVKFGPETNNERIEEEGVRKIMSYMLRCFVRSPRVSLQALIKSTDMVYTITGDDTYWSDEEPLIYENEFGIVDQGKQTAKDIVSFTSERLYSFLKGIFWYIGTMNLLVIIAALAKLRLRRKADRRRILMVLSMLLYNFGTMLLLSGRDYRFFYYSFLITPVLLLIVMREDTDASAGEAELTAPDPAEKAPVIAEKSGRSYQPRH